MPRLALAVLIGTLAAACSSEATRFSDNPFGSPFGGKTADATPPVPAVPAGKVQSRALPPVGQQSQEDTSRSPDRGIVTGSIQAQPGAPQPVKSFGGRKLVDHGRHLPHRRRGQTISHAVVALRRARDGVAGPRIIRRLAPTRRPDTQITIPVYSDTGRRWAIDPDESDLRQARDRRSASRSIFATWPPPRRSPPRKNPRPPRAGIRAGEGEACRRRAIPAATDKGEAARGGEGRTRRRNRRFGRGSGKSDSPQFRWPARGRVISRFGGDGNDGINISVPEGTSVRAAEDGTVAYVGDEIKGYGKLVLVRHANGWVSAYANNADLLVKKGDNVKRGQVLRNQARPAMSPPHSFTSSCVRARRPSILSNFSLAVEPQALSPFSHSFSASGQRETSGRFVRKAAGERSPAAFRHARDAGKWNRSSLVAYFFRNLLFTDHAHGARRGLSIAPMIGPSGASPSVRPSAGA